MKRVVVLLFLSVFILAASGCEHVHAWTDATCESSKICSKCGVQEGDPLGHVVESRTIMSDATCTTDGIQFAHCSRCNLDSLEIIDKLSHIPGETKTTIKASNCIKETYCLLCNNIIQTEEYALSAKEKQEMFADYSVDELLSELSLNAFRAEQTFQGKYICLTGVVQTIDSDGKYFSLEPLEQKWFSFDSIKCQFTSDEQRNAFFDYNKGDILSIYCQVVDIGEIIGYTVDIIEVLKEDVVVGEYHAIYEDSAGAFEDIYLWISTVDDSTYSLSYVDMLTGKGIYDIYSTEVSHYDSMVSVIFRIDNYYPEHKGMVEIIIDPGSKMFPYGFISEIDGIGDTRGTYSSMSKRPRDW